MASQYLAVYYVRLIKCSPVSPEWVVLVELTSLVSNLKQASSSDSVAESKRFQNFMILSEDVDEYTVSYRAYGWHAGIYVKVLKP